ncbi:MAG: transporter [Bacteroidales bacterium]|nr:transporter [Bacteroidales bacterium]
MLSGVAAYLIYAALPLSVNLRAFASDFVSFLQPAMIFCMLFLSFSRINPKDLRFTRWHLWLLLIQSGCFVAMALIIHFTNFSQAVDILIESAMLCLICPTATASVVITDKLGGDVAAIVAYTMMINMTTALVVSLFIPILNPTIDMAFWQAFVVMIRKVFSILVLPLILAIFVRKFLPAVNKLVCKPKDLPFYLWVVSLSLALAVTTRSIAHTDVSWYFIMGIGLISALCCIFQFKMGHLIGRHYKDKVTAGQAFGQKNTIFLIWISYTFMNPVTSLAGGLYSIWHNLYNSYQLYQKRKTT